MASKVVNILTTPLIGPGLSGCCTIVSVFGALILFVLGIAFDRNAEVLMGHQGDPESGRAVAQTCFGAAIVYAIMILVCGCQLGASTRRARNQPGAVRL